jgi:hypothetical protein
VRTGSGELIKMTKKQTRDDIEDGVKEAAEKAHIPETISIASLR